MYNTSSKVESDKTNETNFLKADCRKKSENSSRIRKGSE